MAGLSDIQTVAEGLFRLYQAIDDMKVCKGQCRRLHASYTELLDTLRHNDESFFGTEYQDAIDQAEFNIKRIARKVEKWSKLTPLQSVISLGDIKRGLEESHREFVQCVARLNVISQMESFRKTTEIERKVDGNHARVDERLQELVEMTNVLRQMLAETNRQDLPSQEILQALQEQSYDVLSPEILRIPQKHLNDVLVTELLPQSVDLTDQVRMLHNYPTDVSSGLIQAYRGEWKGKEVDLNLIHCIQRKPNAKRRLMLEARKWHGLNHENIAKIYGTATVGVHLFIVSSRAADENVLTYLGNNSRVDGLRVMVDVAVGLEYLHNNGIIHGNLLPTDVMISEKGVAYIINYGIFVILEEEAIDHQSANDSSSSSRRLAPELIDPRLAGSQLGKRNAATDVWSYGVLCLEILSGQRPFHNRESVIRSTRPLLEGNLPGVSSRILELVDDCCQRDPQSRPTMNQIVQRMRALRVSSSSTLSTVSSVSEVDSPMLPPINDGSQLFADSFLSFPWVQQPSAHRSLQLSPNSVGSTDRESPHIKYQEDGTVEAGNLSGLVHRLVQDSGDKEMDRQFREIFLASYPAFAEDKAVLFRLLCDEYNAVSSPLHNAEQQTGVRNSVLTVLHQWLQMDHMQSEDLQLLRQMRELAQSIQPLGNSALKFMEFIDKAMKPLLNPRPMSFPSPYKDGSVHKPLDVEPEVFAAAFTDLESKKFNNITASDCIRWLTNVERPNGVSHFISENEKLSYWIQAYILSLPTHSQRSKILKYFFCVAEECRKLRNFSTTHAILAGITSSSIAGLKRTCELDRQTREKLRKHKGGLMSQSNNFSAYRGALKESKAPCIPLLSVHMDDVRLIHGREPSFMKQEGHRDVMNFGLYRRVYDGIRDVLDYQCRPLRLAIRSRHSEICKFIEDGLGSFVVNEAFHRRLQRRSAHLAEEEQANYRSYDAELRAGRFL